MSDRIKGCLSTVFLVLAILLPLAGLVIGWAGWDLRTGAIAAMVTFIVLFVLGSALLLLIKNPSWLQVMLPFLGGMAYSVLNVIPLPVDDVVVAMLGAGLSYVLSLKKSGGLSRWTIIPMAVSALYTLVGDLVPGPLDELITAVLSAVTARVVAVAGQKSQTDADERG